MASIPIQRRRTDLPIESYAAQIAEAIGQGALVLTAEPGAGKTSIVPSLAARAMAGEVGRVLVLQPRRLAARAAAQRLSNLVIDCRRRQDEFDYRCVLGVAEPQPDRNFGAINRDDHRCHDGRSDKVGAVDHDHHRIQVAKVT